MKTDKEIGQICKEIIKKTSKTSGFSDIEQWEITKRFFESFIITCKIQGIDIAKLEIERKKIYGDYNLNGKQIKVIDVIK